MALFSAFLDANVMVPIAPCDLLLRLAEKGAFRPLWSQKVIDEAQAALEKIHPQVDPNRFQTRFRSMNQAFEDALVSGWEGLVGGLELPDPNDRHVVAAALRGNAEVIVTNNVKDFPDRVLRVLGLQAISMDDFLLDTFSLNREGTLYTLQEQADSAGNPPLDFQTLLDSLRRGGAPNLVEAVKAFQSSTAG